ncbi:unnamed protein product [Calypogeia fissa]
MLAVSPILRGTPGVMDDSKVFSLLDQSWYSQSIFNHSTPSLSSLPFPSMKSSIQRSAVSAAGMESDTTVRSTEGGGANGTASSTGCGRNCYSMDESEMRRVFDRFDENADGLISGEELRRWCMKCFGKDVSKAEADSMITSVDRNNDGAVDFKDFLSLYQTHCLSLEEQEDNNNSNKASENEAENEEEDDLLLEAFRAFDKNLDGQISAEELQVVLINLGMPEGKSLLDCEEMIRKVDRNGDGRCDLQEFEEMMSSESFFKNSKALL